MFAGMAQKACPIWLNFLKGTHAHTGGDIVKMAGVSLNNNKKNKSGLLNTRQFLNYLRIWGPEKILTIFH